MILSALIERAYRNKTRVERRTSRVQGGIGTAKVCALNPSATCLLLEHLDDVRLTRIPLGNGGESFTSHETDTDPRRQIRPAMCTWICGHRSAGEKIMIT